MKLKIQIQNYGPSSVSHHFLHHISLVLPSIITHIQKPEQSSIRSSTHDNINNDSGALTTSVHHRRLSLRKYDDPKITVGKGQKLGDGCYHVFLDVGSNIGVHNRFLFEPGLYPNAKTALSVFDQEFGEKRNNLDICAFGFEPNPVHEERHNKMMEEYNKLGWRYHYIQGKQKHPSIFRP